MRNLVLFSLFLSAMISFASVRTVDKDPIWKSFDDPLLDSLLTVAVQQNPSVLMAIDRMASAQAALRMARSGYYPVLSVGAGWNREQTSGSVTAQPVSRESSYDLTANVSWQADLFGSIRQRVNAQRMTFVATEQEYRFAILSLCAEVASSYVQYRELQEELAVVNANVVSQAAVLAITEVRFKTGLVSKLDVLQARSVYFSTKASIPTLESGVRSYGNALAILLGLYPSELRTVLETKEVMPNYIALVPKEIPISLLRRRPDVLAAESQVEAQAALVGASKADWLPKVFLRGSVGYESHELDRLVRKNSATFTIAPSITWTLFQGTQLVNATRQAKAQLDESINSYNQTLLAAVQEADDAVTTYQNSIRQIVALREVCLQGEQTLTLSLDLYKQGLTPFQNVLDAQRSLLSYQNALVQAQGSSLLSLIQMYRSLGGDWTDTIPN